MGPLQVTLRRGQLTWQVTLPGTECPWHQASLTRLWLRARSVRVRALRASLSGEHFLSGSPVLKEVEGAVRARTAALLEEDARAAADPNPNVQEDRLVAALLEGERRLARADGL